MSKITTMFSRFRCEAEALGLTKYGHPARLTFTMWPSSRFGSKDSEEVPSTFKFAVVFAKS